MSEKKEKLIHTTQTAAADDELRFLPFAVAGLICFTIAVLLGAGSWFLFGSPKRTKTLTVAETTVPVNPPAEPAPVKTEDASPAPAPAVEPVPPVERKPVNVVEVPGGEIALGGGETKRPIQRTIVGAFAIAETEVTNAQYAEFVRETRRSAPAGWKNERFPDGTADFPVTNVSWADAAAYCKWLGKKLGLPVRLPTEAEWEFAARGTESLKYPWGNEWNDEAATSKEKGGKISSVKKFPLNRSPFGAYDMVGNVWEWTEDKVVGDAGITDEQVKAALEKGQTLRVVKGGSALEKAAQISIGSRYEIPETTRVPAVGFRYVVEQKQNP
ncbi:MAG: SUMF1/EgtB/PvdO family nonheme iron enzyme [Acidobacteria bacterium]|nr:SUMF1/EgtB/PvdO family nonheme iron enzyme [Acidobacteriota bacterium]